MNEPLSIDQLFALRDQKQEKLEAGRKGHKERQRAILQLHLVDGMSMVNIGKQYGISRARVHQIITQAK
jgi:DNA-directed RNA polymerase specialized sigma subunit